MSSESFEIDLRGIKKQTVFWVLFLLAFLFIIWGVGQVLTPFIVGIVLAYFVEPLVQKMADKGIPRWLSALIILLSAFIIFIGFWAVLLPVIIDQVIALGNRLPEYYNQSQEFVLSFIERNVSEDQATQIKSAVKGQSGALAQWAKNILGGVLSGGQAVFGFISFVVIVPVVAFYMIRDWAGFTKKVDDLLPRKYAETIRSLLKEFDKTLAGFIRGQALVCITLGAFYSIALSIVGLNFGVVIGMLSGVLSFIPYVGSTFGFLASVGVAIFQFQNWTMPLVVAGIFIFGQIIEGNVLTPRMVGKSVGLHAVWVLLALMVGGSLFGFIGVLIAVPVAALIGVLVRFAIGIYKRSFYYGGGEDRYTISFNDQDEESSSGKSKTKTRKKSRKQVDN